MGRGRNSRQASPYQRPTLRPLLAPPCLGQELLEELRVGREVDARVFGSVCCHGSTDQISAAVSEASTRPGSSPF